MSNTGYILDANLHPASAVRYNWLMYTQLGLVGRGSDTAAKICGCYWAPHRCKRYVDDRNIPISACDMPTIVKDPKWRLLP